MIALTGQGRRLIEAMKTAEVQALAWREHGLRTEHTAIEAGMTAGFPGIPATLTAAIPSPSLEVMERLLVEAPPVKP